MSLEIKINPENSRPFILYIFNKYPDVIKSKEEYEMFLQCDVGLLNNHNGTFSVIKHRSFESDNIFDKNFSFDEISTIFPNYIKKGI